MSRTAARLVVAVALAAGPAHAAPTIVVDGCRFDAAPVAAALARERAGATTPAAITAQIACTADGDARLTITTSDGRVRTRDVDLRDVPAALAPRVLALVLAAVVAELDERPATDPPPTTIEPPATAPPTPATAPPATAPPTPAPPTTAPPTPATAPPAPAIVVAPPALAPGPGEPAARLAPDRRVVSPRASLLGDRRWSPGVAGRALLRTYTAGDTRLWGGAITAVGGPWTLGVVAARGAIDHPLGQVMPWLVGVEVGATIACAGAQPSTCIGARVEAGRMAIGATAADPMTTTHDLAALEVHGAAELSVTLRTRGVELAASLALGAGSGLVARANAVEVAHLAGWTLGGALEVRP